MHIPISDDQAHSFINFNPSFFEYAVNG